TVVLGGYGLGNALSVTWDRANEPVRAKVGRLTASMFDVLKVWPLHGRAFDANDAPGGGTGPVPDPRVLILSYGAWQRWFGGSNDAIGATIRIDELPVTIVGVMPAGFTFPDPETQAWLPMPIGAVVGGTGVKRIMLFAAMARLKPGVTPQQAAA